MSNQALKCSQQVRAIPLERFRLPTDGRKWRQVARGRKSLLSYVSSFANSDGTFARNGRNFSPGNERLLKDFSAGSLYRLLNDLRETGLLSWARTRHYDRREFTIHLDTIDLETPPTSSENHSPDSDESLSTFTENHSPNSTSNAGITLQIGENHSPRSPESLSTVETIRPYPPKEPSREREPSTAETQNRSHSPVLAAQKSAEKRTRSIKQALDYIMERAKTLSDGKAEFKKTAKHDLELAIAELFEQGKVSKQELNSAIQAKLDRCSSKDPVSYTIFGSSLASDLVASVRVIRQRNEASEYRRQKQQWIDAYLAAAADLTIDDLNLWYGEHRPPNPRSEDDEYMFEQVAHQADRIREELLQKRNATQHDEPESATA